MSNAISQSLTINRVSLVSESAISESEQQVLRRHAANALEQLSIRPSMPPAAVLIIRSLSDPQPGQLLASYQAGRGQSERGQSAWAQATQDALTRCWQRASRPALGDISADANSVWFADVAEWLACLTLDLQRQRAKDLWWWQVSLQPYMGLSAGDTTAALWQENAQWVPTTLRWMCDRAPAETIQLINSLSAAQVEAILGAIAETFSFSLPSSSLEIVQRLSPHIAHSARRFVQGNQSAQALVALSWTLPNAVQILQAPASTESEPDSSTDSSIDERVFADEGKRDDSKTAQGDLAYKADYGSEGRKNALNDDFVQTAYERPTVVDDKKVEQTLPMPETTAGIATQLGGLWYLVNVLLVLDWPYRSTGMTPWHQLLALSQALLPEHPPDLVWQVLEALAQPPCAEAAIAQWTQLALAQVLPYFSARLENPDMIATYLQEPALLYATETHIDVVFSLDQIRLDLRVAGLDQDPGWVPELGRAIAFHYE